MFTLILAGSPQEALTFAKDVGLTRPRVATAAGSIRGLRVSNVIELPSFWARPDKHAVLAELRTILRRDRDATHILYDEWVQPRDRPTEPATPEGQLPGQLSLDDVPPIVGEVIQTSGSSSRAEVLERPSPMSVSTIKAVRRAGR